jgi:hypothetical protein
VETSDELKLNEQNIGKALQANHGSRDQYFNVLFYFFNCQIEGSLYFLIVKKTNSCLHGEIQVLLDGPTGNPEEVLVNFEHLR